MLHHQIKPDITFTFFLFSLLFITGSCKTASYSSNKDRNKFQPPSIQIQNEIEQMDSVLFEAYNNCRMEIMDSIFSENIEFYHDQGGLSTSKRDLLLAVKNNICGKVTRHLKVGTIEVYPIANYGAVEMGMHRFHNAQEKENPIHYSKFVHIWKKEATGWKLSRVVSLH